MRKALFLLSIILLIGCDNLKNKSILEPLSLEELSDEMKKDTLFAPFYEYVQDINKNSLDTDSKKAKYAELTYRRVYNLYYYKDTTLYNKFSDEWKEKYGSYTSKVDSVSNYWKQIKQEQSLDQYVKVELANVSTKYYRYTGGVEDVILRFKLIPLKGKIDQMEFSYSITPKINADDYDTDDYNKILERKIASMDGNWCLYSSPFSKEVIGNWKADYTNKNKLAGKTKDEILRDYDVNIKIEKIRFNGENINDVEIPYNVRRYWDEGDNGNMKDFYFDEIVKEFIDKKYITSFEYVSDRYRQHMNKIDNLAYEYLCLPIEKEGK